MFQISKEKATTLGANITIQEVEQQPSLWQEAYDNYLNYHEAAMDFLREILEKHPFVRVILTGAGTSAYVGETAAPYLKGQYDPSKVSIEAIPTTDLVSNPYEFFKEDIPTILVSYARSGNSPESIAATELGGQIVKAFYQVTITCAKEGKLALAAKDDEKNLLVMMPSGANDQGFAMTGSYTCMLLSTLLIFDGKSVEEKADFVKKIIAMGSQVLNESEKIHELASTDFRRVVYLGSGVFVGNARESQLKILELTAGKIATLYDSSMGFRHGPKSFVDEKTIVIGMVSNHPYTRQYDIDVLEEIRNDEIVPRCVALSVTQDEMYQGENCAFSGENQSLPDAYLALPYVVFAQTFALAAALKVGNTPDTPSPSGTVNRVVKGVILHKYEA